MTPHRRKTLVYFALSLALFAVAVFWVGMETSWAQRAGPGVSAPPATPATPTAGTPSPGGRFSQSLQGLSSTVGGLTGNIAIGVIILHAVVFAAYELLFYLLALAGTLLNYFYTLNLLATPSSLVVVLAGWATLRDLANGVFILLVLWVAITIIFNLETLGGKRLLVRIIVIALLINFSLLMVTTVFAFTNQVARAFARPLGLDPFSATTPRTGISDFIIKNTRIHTVAQTIKDKGVADQLTAEAEAMAARAREDAQRAAGAPVNPPTTSPEPFTKGMPGYLFGTLKQALGAPYTIPEAKAIEAGTVSTGAGIVAAACAVGGLILGAPSGPGALATAAAAASLCTSLATITSLGVGLFAFLGGSGGPVAWEFNIITNLAVADIFLALTTVAMFTAMILLAVRYIAMHLIAIFAPIAFLAFALPRYGERVWNMWLDNLFRWAFVAPIFYFLLYLSLLMLQLASDAQSQIPTAKDVPFPGNAISILGFVMFLVFFWASIFLTRKAAGMGAEAALAFGKKLAGVGLGVGTGLAARWALPAAGRFATKAGEWINQRPYARTILGRGLPGYGLRRVAGASRQQVVDAQARINRMGLTDTEIQQALASGRFRNSMDVAAAALILKNNRNLKPLPGVRGYGDDHLRQAKDTLRNLGVPDYVSFLRANPNIAAREDFAPDDRGFNTTDPNSNLSRVLAEYGHVGQTPTAAETQEAAEWIAWQRVRPGDIETMDLDMFSEEGDPDGMNKKMFWRIAGGDHLSRLGRLNTRTADTLQRYLDSPQGQIVWNSFDSERKRKLTEYFASNAAKEFSWHLPSYAATGGTGGTPAGGGGGGTPPTP